MLTLIQLLFKEKFPQYPQTIFPVILVVRQGYQVQVYDEFVIRGNTAVLRCQVPSMVRDYVIVTTWEREDGVTIVSNVANGFPPSLLFPDCRWEIH
ncbi:uncharacterized protein TNCT_106621 [Trichonephila clavata]|uniref:Down syndrome cell adhesion molecule-like protein Dscam2 n=1 Tax=Trichonephila clavata TaxID=2740835 RepID=A0A8X6F8S9_TRICU|nr:uncharacterized protein TNCT_106621 [Trichonephila clavata]